MTHGDTWPMACLHTFVCLSLLFAYVYVRIQMVLSVSQVSCVVRFVGLLICVCALCFIITYVVMISVPCCSEIVPRCSQARSRQRCTDIPCCIVFLAAIAAFGMVYIKALATGNIARLYHGANWQGEVCGVDPAVVDKPMLYWCMKSQFGGIPEAWEKGGGGSAPGFSEGGHFGGSTERLATVNIGFASIARGCTKFRMHLCPERPCWGEIPNDPPRAGQGAPGRPACRFFHVPTRVDPQIVPNPRLGGRPRCRARPAGWGSS